MSKDNTAPRRESKQIKSLRAIRKSAALAVDELDDIDLVRLRLEYIIKKVNDTWPHV
jgi:hypothetical protein